jgi:hypothetical protein
LFSRKLLAILLSSEAERPQNNAKEDEKMTQNEKELAKIFAKNIIELERRGDFGGLRDQAASDFELQAAAFKWTGNDYKRGFRMPSGRIAFSEGRAIYAWARA